MQSLKMASLCSALWGGTRRGTGRGRGLGHRDVDGRRVCLWRPRSVPRHEASLPVRERQEIMGLLEAKGGPRNWQVAGMFVDVLGPVESFARTPYRRIEAPYGDVFADETRGFARRASARFRLSRRKPESSRLREKARRHDFGRTNPVDWSEIRRIANLPEYRNLQSA